MNCFSTPFKPAARPRIGGPPSMNLGPPPAARPSRKGPRDPEPPPPNGYCDEALARAGYTMWRVLDANPKLSLQGFSDFECNFGFAGDADKPYSFWDIEGIVGTLNFILDDTWSHYRGRALMLSIEHLTQFIAARWSLRRRGRLLRTAEMNRTLASSELMRIAGLPPHSEASGAIGPHGVFLAAAIANGLIVEPIKRDGRLAGDAWLNLSLRPEWRGR